jgi:hypothetical protein
LGREEARMLGIVDDAFKMGDYMDGRAELMRLREIPA